MLGGQDQKRSYSQRSIVKTLNMQSKERTLKASRVKSQVSSKGEPITITADFSDKLRTTYFKF